MSSRPPSRFGRIAIGGGIAAVALGILAASVPRYGARQPVEAGDWPGPVRPWRAIEDGKLARKIGQIDRRLALRAAWRCDTASCGFEGRYLVVSPNDPQQSEAIGDAHIEYVLAALARPQSGDVEWPAMPDGQAQAFRLPQGPAYVFVQTDRAAGAPRSVVAGAALDQVIAARFPDAKPAAITKPAPVRKSVPATLGPTPAPPDTPPAAGSRPAWQ